VSTQPGRYVLNAVISRYVIDAEEARADWEACDPELREGSLEGGFTVYVRGEMGHRIAPVTYTPLPDAE
jgi:hypothetical protein